MSQRLESATPFVYAVSDALGQQRNLMVYSRKRALGKKYKPPMQSQYHHKVAKSTCRKLRSKERTRKIILVQLVDTFSTSEAGNCEGASHRRVAFVWEDTDEGCRHCSSNGWNKCWV